MSVYAFRKPSLKDKLLAQEKAEKAVKLKAKVGKNKEKTK